MTPPQRRRQPWRRVMAGRRTSRTLDDSRSSAIRRARCSRSSHQLCADAHEEDHEIVFERNLTIPSKAEALPGAPRAHAGARATHFVNGHRLAPPFPDGTRARACSAWAASGAPRRSSGSCPASTRPRSATPPATRRTRRTARSARGMTGHNEVVLVVFDPEDDQLRRAAEGVLGEPRSDAGHAPGQRRRHAVPLGHLLLRRRAAARGRSVARRVPDRS